MEPDHTHALAAMEQEEEFHGMEGRCVEVYDMEYTYCKTLARRERDRKLVNVNGKQGRCGSWITE